MEQLKYVIVLGDADIETAIVFNENLTHKDVVRHYKIGRVVSAGFCSLLPMLNIVETRRGVNVWGKSETLQKDCRPQDGEIIQKQLFPE